MSARMNLHLPLASRLHKPLVVACLGITACVAALPSYAADQASASAVSPSAAPISAMMAAHAASGLLLGVVNTGQHLVAVGGNGVVVLSDDGANWMQVETPVDVTLTGVSFADDQHGWARRARCADSIHR